MDTHIWRGAAELLGFDQGDVGAELTSLQRRTGPSRSTAEYENPQHRSIVCRQTPHEHHPNGHAAPGDRRWWLADCANRASRAWQCMLHPETSRFICLILARKLISICRQPMLIAATRCYLIQMLRSALTCINDGSCWSPGEENGPRFFLTMDVPCRLS